MNLINFYLFYCRTKFGDIYLSNSWERIIWIILHSGNTPQRKQKEKIR